MGFKIKKPKLNVKNIAKGALTVAAPVTILAKPVAKAATQITKPVIKETKKMGFNMGKAFGKVGGTVTKFAKSDMGKVALGAAGVGGAVGVAALAAKSMGGSKTSVAGRSGGYFGRRRSRKKTAQWYRKESARLLEKARYQKIQMRVI